MSGGVTLMSRIYFDNNQNNFYGEYCAMYIGAIGEGIAFRIKNTQNSDAYTGHLLIGGAEVATVNLTKNPTSNAPNGGWEIVYDGSNVTVGSIPIAGGPKTLITWNLTAGGTNTEISASGIDLTDANIGFRVAGNWATDKRHWTVYSLTVEQPTSSAPASSAPASSAPASSEPASSEPASSEPASSEPASSEPASSEPDSSVAPVVGEKLVAEISGELKAEDWDPSDNIVNGQIATSANDAVVGVTSVKTYDLGTDWSASLTFTTPTYMGNMWSQPVVLTVGELQAIAYNSDGTNGARIALNVKGAEAGTFSLGAGVGTSTADGYGGKLTLTYKDGQVTVGYKDADVITYDASADNLDFSAVKTGVSAKGNWAAAPKNFKITEFSLTSADVAPEPGAPIDTITDGVFNATDWTGDTGNISGSGQFYATGNTKKTIWTAKAYDLSGGFKYSSRIYFKNGYNNYNGEHAAIYIGDIDSGIEVRIKNNAGAGMYTGFIYVKGEQVATADLLNAPNGGWEIVYRNGKITVNHEEVAVTWELADTSTTTAVDVSSVDLSKAKIGMHIEGNWSPEDKRLWNTYNLSPLSGGGSGGSGGTTGDARNLVVPAVALVLGTCAVAFVATRKKENA